MKFRMGINLGDVIVDGDRIYGDGVNIAARLESLAAGGGICIAGSVYEQVKTKLALGYEDMGAQHVKNIAEPVHVYRVWAEPGAAVPPGRLHEPRGPTPWRRGALVTVALLALLGGAVSVWQLVARTLPSSPTKPSIAVLPFVNMSGESEQEYLSDGMTEDLITELSRLNGLLIIARSSAFMYKGKAVKPEQVSRELGVRYMLEGRVRTANNRIRITAQLVDGTTGYHVWAQSYDRDLDDIFAVQGEIARMITRSLAVQLTAAEEKHMGSPTTTSPAAWQYVVDGTKLYRRFTSTDNAQARALFLKAIALDPNFARAYAMLAATHRQDWILAWAENLKDSERQAYDNAQKAVQLARSEPDPKPSLPQALLQLGFVYLYQGKLEEATKAANEVVAHSPNYADGYALAAHALIYQGRPEDALKKMEPTVTQDPAYPYFYNYYRGHAYYVWGFQTPATDPLKTERFKEAEKYLRKALDGNDKGANFRPARSYLVAVLSELNRQQEAVNEMVKVRTTGGRPDYLRDPKLLEQFIKRTLPYKDPAITARLIELWQAAEKGAAARTGTAP